MSGKSFDNNSIFENLFSFIQNNKIIDCSENVCSVLFYYVFCTACIENNNVFDFDISTFEKILNKASSNNFAHEYKLINAIIQNDLALVRNFDFSVFSASYGKKECNNFLNIFDSKFNL